MSVRSAVAILMTFSPLTAMAQGTCGLPMKGSQTSECSGAEAKKGKKSCTRGLLYDKSAVVFSTGLHVNTDGNLRSYSAGDPYGSKCAGLSSDADPLTNGCAMDTVCNAVFVVSVRPDGTTVTLPGVVDGDRGACKRMVTEFSRIRDAKWLPPDGSRVDFGGVIATTGDKGDPRHVPCEVSGFLVSMASTPSGVPPKDRCDPAQWVDSSVPSIVVPQCWSASYRAKNSKLCAKYLKAINFPDVRPGDLVAVQRTGQPDKPLFVLVGDTGPNAKVGEASVGFHLLRLGRTNLPRTKAQSDALDAFEDQFDIVVFPGSALKGVNLTQASLGQIAKASSDGFTAWGGSGGLGAAISKLTACSAQARQ